jgi:hypothetical protein
MQHTILLNASLLNLLWVDKITMIEIPYRKGVCFLQKMIARKRLGNIYSVTVEFASSAGGFLDLCGATLTSEFPSS